MTKDALLIFLSNPKLSQPLGEQKALEINEKLQVLTNAATKNLSCEKIVFFPDNDFMSTAWSNQHYTVEVQHGKHLNKRLSNAFNKYILQNSDDINKVVITCADCPQLTQQLIEKAFESLNKYDVCIGPEKKGNYYLIGMKEPLSFLFADKLWSGKQLLDDTLEELIEHGKKYFLLPELQSVNDIYDLHLIK